MTIFPPRETIGLAPAPLITEMPSPKKTGKLAPVAPRIKKIEYFTEQRFTKLSKKGNVLPLLRQQTGNDGHENIASFVEKKFGRTRKKLCLC